MITIKILNTDEVERAIEKYGAEALTKIKLTLRQAGALVEGVAKLNIQRGRPEWPPLKPETVKRKKSSKPLIDTGTLLNSITHKIEGNACLVGPFGVKYAVYQEFGTSRIPARPFLRPALLENEEKIKALFKQALKL